MLEDAGFSLILSGGALERATDKYIPYFPFRDGCLRNTAADDDTGVRIARGRERSAPNFI